jgi:hypothetical protein
MTKDPMTGEKIRIACHGRRYYYYAVGFNAGAAGKGISDCPRNLHGSDRDAWRDGLWSWLETNDDERIRELLA